MVKETSSMVVSMRLPMESAKRLRRLANRYGWTPSDASARLVEEGLRRTEFAFGVAHSPAQDWIELWSIAHRVSKLNIKLYVVAQRRPASMLV